MTAFFAFIAFCGIVISGGIHNFHHAVEKHDQPTMINHEIPELKARGVGLPGGLREPQAKNETP